MKMEEIKPKPNLVEMAKKRRRIHLVEKLATGKPQTPSLTKSEIKELETFEIPAGSPTVVDSQEKVAKILGVSDRTVRHWIKEGMPVTPQNQYDLIEIRSWRLLRDKRKKSKESKKKDAELWETKYREYKAKLAEITLKQKLGQLIPRAQVESQLVQVSLAIKRSLLALPRSVAPQLVGLETREIEVILSGRIKEAINLIAEGKIFEQNADNNEANKITTDLVEPGS